MLKKIWGFISDYREMKENLKFGRELVGKDRNGNKYFQHFNSKQQPTKRTVEMKFQRPDAEIDPIWDDWLRHRQKDPFTPEQLKNIYEERENNKTVAFEYEKKDAEVMQNFRKEYKSRENEKNSAEKNSAGKSNETDYEPGTWKSQQKK